VCVSKVTQKVEWIFLKVGEQVMIHHRGVNSILEVIGNIFWALVCHICHHTTTDGLHIEPGDFVDCSGQYSINLFIFTHALAAR